MGPNNNSATTGGTNSQDNGSVADYSLQLTVTGNGSQNPSSGGGTGIEFGGEYQTSGPTQNPINDLTQNTVHFSSIAQVPPEIDTVVDNYSFYFKPGLTFQCRKNLIFNLNGVLGVHDGRIINQVNFGLDFPIGGTQKKRNNDGSEI